MFSAHRCSCPPRTKTQSFIQITIYEYAPDGRVINLLWTPVNQMFSGSKVTGSGQTYVTPISDNNTC